jgi:hypothetical protein
VFGRNCEKIDFETTTAMMYCNLHREHCMIKWKYIYIYIYIYIYYAEKEKGIEPLKMAFTCFVLFLFYFIIKGGVTL